MKSKINVDFKPILIIVILFLICSIVFLNLDKSREGKKYKGIRIDTPYSGKKGLNKNNQ